MAGGAKIVVMAALIGNFAIFVTKLGAAQISGSSAMMAEAFHSLSDTLNQVLLLIGLKLAMKPPDEKHPFGYRAEQYFWSLLVAIALFGIAGGLSIYEGYHKLHEPEEISHLNWIYGTLAMAFLFEAVVLRVAVKEVRHYQHKHGYESLKETILRSKDPVTTAVFIEDSLALTGLAIAFFAVWGAVTFDLLWLDALASLLIGLLLMSFSLFIAAKVKGLIIGQAAEPERVAALRKAIEGLEEVDRLLELKTMHLGPEMVLINLSVAFDPDLDTDGVAEATDRVDQTATRIFPQNMCYVETEDPIEEGQEDSLTTKEEADGNDEPKQDNSTGDDDSKE